jgi:hypothetical protein
MDDETTVEIGSLEVRFEADMDDDERTFKRLFDREIKKWSRMSAEEQARQRRLSAERSLISDDEDV